MYQVALSTTIMESPVEGISFGRMLLISGTFPETRMIDGGTLKFFWQHMVAQQFTKTLYFSFNSLPVGICCIYKNG